MRGHVQPFGVATPTKRHHISALVATNSSMITHPVKQFPVISTSGRPQLNSTSGWLKKKRKQLLLYDMRWHQVTASTKLTKSP